MRPDRSRDFLTLASWERQFAVNISEFSSDLIHGFPGSSRFSVINSYGFFRLSAFWCAF